VSRDRLRDARGDTPRPARAAHHDEDISQLPGGAAASGGEAEIRRDPEGQAGTVAFAGQVGQVQEVQVDGKGGDEGNSSIDLSSLMFISIFSSARTNTQTRN
jgi:hypothetical protein